jgi:hypothetical protein
MAHLVPPGYGERHVRKVWFRTAETRLASLVSKVRSYEPIAKASGGKRESDGDGEPGPLYGHRGPDYQ